jgi:hypothetical protein
MRVDSSKRASESMQWPASFFNSLASNEQTPIRIWRKWNINKNMTGRNETVGILVVWEKIRPLPAWCLLSTVCSSICFVFCCVHFILNLVVWLFSVHSLPSRVGYERALLVEIIICMLILLWYDLQVDQSACERITNKRMARLIYLLVILVQLHACLSLSVSKAACVTINATVWTSARVEKTMFWAKIGAFHAWFSRMCRELMYSQTLWSVLARTTLPIQPSKVSALFAFLSKFRAKENRTLHSLCERSSPNMFPVQRASSVVSYVLCLM